MLRDSGYREVYRPEEVGSNIWRVYLIPKYIPYGQIDRVVKVLQERELKAYEAFIRCGM